MALLRSDPNITQKAASKVIRMVQEIVKKQASFMGSILEEGRMLPLEFIKTYLEEQAPHAMATVEECLKKLGSEHKQKKFFKEARWQMNAASWLPEKKMFARWAKSSESSMEGIPGPFCDVKGIQSDVVVYIPLRAVIEKLAAEEGFFETLLDYKAQMVSKANAEELISIHGSACYQAHQLLQQENTLGLYLYSDEIDPANPIGAHKKVYKQTMVYYSFCEIPAEYRGKLEFIFLAASFNSKLLRQFEDLDLLEPLLNELTSLQQEGVKMTLHGEKKTVRFAIFQLLGDNLDMNAKLGFTTSFSCGEFCRFCRMEKKDTQEATTEDAHLVKMRIEEYEEMVATVTRVAQQQDEESGGRQQNFILGGIKRPCVFARIPNFDVLQSAMKPDFMHDLLEGIIPLTAKFCLHHIFALRPMRFNYAMFKKRMEKFPWGVKNKPPTWDLKVIRDYASHSSAGW